MSQNKNSTALKNNKLFDGLDFSKLKLSVNQKNVIDFNEGDIIFQKGDSSEQIYLVIEGVAKVKISGGLGGPVIAEKNKNDFFGEKELIMKKPRASSAVAETNCIMYTLTRKELEELIKKDPKLKDNLYKSVGELEEDGGWISSGTELEEAAKRTTTEKFSVEEEKKEENLENQIDEHIEPAAEESPGEPFEKENVEQEETPEKELMPEENEDHLKWDFDKDDEIHVEWENPETETLDELPIPENVTDKTELPHDEEIREEETLDNKIEPEFSEETELNTAVEEETNSIRRSNGRNT